MAQVNDNDDIKWLYGKLKAKGYNIGSEAEFKSSLANGEDRKWYYEKAKGMGLNMGSMDDFESMYAPKAAPAPKRETPSSGQRKPASAVSASPEQPKKQKPKGTPMTEQDKIRMSLQMGQMKQQVQKGIANTNAKIGRMMEPLTQKGRERRRLGEFQARMAGTPTHVVGFNTASPAPAGSGARGGSRQKPVQSEQSPQPYGVKYENGKAKTQWVLPDGTLTTSLIEANQAEYEARTARLAHQFQNRMKENGLDPNKPEDVRKQAQLDYETPMRKAIEDEWQRAEAEDRAADEAYRKDMERAEGGSFWDRLKKSITPLGPDGMPLRRGDETLRDIKRAAKRQDTFNLEKMAQSVLQNMPQEYKDNQMLNYSRYFREHPSELKGRTVSQAAKEALQGEVYHATYERAVQARMPKSKTEFLLRKVADQPFFSQTMSDNMAARLFSHSIGTEAADMDAMGRYGTDHRALDITGTVLNMAIDPTTYISGGVGSFAGKQALKLSGKMALKGASKEAAERYVGRTLAGRMVAGVAAGSANFGTFEGLKNMQQQMRLGGTLNPETGEYEFSAGDMLKATGHGMLLGSVTGTLSPVLGNVSDKLVKATESTAGKVGIRAGELMTSTVAEGTIFATPEWIENAQLADDDPRKRKAMDIWTDNMAMMLGFKVSHGIKSAPQVIAGLRPIAEPKTMEERNHNRRSFAERLRKRMDASPRDLDFTKEEREELRRNGYGDLASLFTRTPKQPNKPKAKPTMTDGKTMTFDVDYQHAEAERVSNPEFDGYEAMERLMQDPNVSQSARAKAYYILTGRMLPMGTVTGYTTNKDANGVTVQAMTAQGEVVTSRHFKTEEGAKKEEANIMRQAELNSVDVGERYKEAAANAKVVQAAVESVAPGADFATVMRSYKAVKEGDKDAIAAYGKMVEDIDRAIEANKTMADGERPEAIRASIKEETGVDVDATLRKEPKNRTEEEQAAVEDYIKRLFPEQKSEEAEQPMSEEESAAAAAYDQARLLWDKVEKGDTDAKAEVDAITLRMQEAYQMCEDAFGADAEMRIAEINEDPWPLVNNPELSEDQQDAVLYYVNAKAAMEGVMDASNEAADGKRKEVEANVERHTHKDMGVVQPATMKVDDKPVYVVKGNVVMLPDGSGIDVRNSDQSIVICDAETGEYKFASPDQLFSLGEAIDPQTELDEAYANIQAEHEAVLGVPENGENVQENGENVPNSAENVSQLTDEQLQQYAHSAFNEATQSNGITIPQEQAEQLQQRNQQMLEQEQQRKEEEANRQPTALERVPINEETGEPMFEKADRETALDALNEITGGNDENTTAIVRAQVEQATKALEALKKKEPTKKSPSLKGSPMAMVKAQQEAEANYNTAMEEYNAQVAAAEENLNAWSRINSLMNDRKRAIREQQEAERKVREEKLHAEAVARLEEDKRIAAEKAAEQEAVGTHAVNPKIKAKWDGATKVEGNPNAITLADGSTIRGHYVLTEAGAATASHDVNNAYEPTEGFPVDENGESVNDRDYKRDKDAQRIVRDMADSYDSRALQTPVIVSKDGVVLSGNNRTMSGEIAAKNGTDKAYVDHLREFGAMFGFTPEQIDGMKHPRVVFVPDEHLPYDATTFARFNAEQQKKQSKPEHAVKLGKIVPDNVFTSITNDISRFDRMSDYYADDKSVASAISQLLDAGVINEMQLPELRTGNALSAAGKELIENTLIGKVFQTSPDAVRQIISTPTLRQSVVMGLNEIANNRTLAKSGYDLSKELAAAVDLVSRAKSDSPEIYKEGMPVSPYGRQQGLFDDEYGDSRVTDGVTLLLADLLNSGKPSDLRKVLSTYNNEAASSAAGQIDMFSGDVTSKEEILKNVNEYFRNATPKEQQALIDAAVAERKRRAEAAESAGGDEASEQATVVAGSDAEPQQPVVASEEPVKRNEADADALAKEAEEKLSERITDTEDEWTEPSEYGEIYKHRMFVDGKEVIKVDAPDKSKNYPGTYYEIDGKQFGDLYEVANYIDGNGQPLSAKIEAASAEVNTNPTEAQKEAGNYKKGHVQVGTFDITIEQPQGSVRKGTDADGKQWESKMNNTYGYIRGAVGVDGDHIDVFLSNDIDGWNGRKVFVVDQYNPDGSFDEHKVMLGFNDVDEAKGDYLANYEQGWENGRRIDITGVNLEDFEKWIESSKRKTKPFGEYSSVKKDVVEINAPEEVGYSITPSTYTNKKGKTSDVSLLTFDHDLTADQERAVKEFAKERTGEGRFAPARGWKDRESGGWMFRSEEDARKAAEMVGNEEAVADNQPMTAQELRDAVEPKKPTTKTASKKPANRVESVPTEEPIEPEKPKYEVSDEEMNGLMNDIRDILGIGDDEGDAGFKFRDPDELTAEQRQKLMSVGQRLAMAMVERGNESFGNYASMMVKALGDKVRPWLKAFYGGLEYVPGYDKYALTPYEEGDADENGNIDPAQMVALLSGNPIIFEKSKQDKLVKKLKSLYNGFLRDQQRKRQNYETVTKKVDNLKRLISLSDSDVHDLQREGFKQDEKGTYPSKVKVCVEGSYYGQDFDKPKEAGQYILEQLKNNKKVVLAGFGQRADVVFVTGDDLLSSHYEVQLGGNNAWSIRYTKRMPQDPTQAGLVFRSLLEQIIHNNEVYHREYDTNSEMLKTMPKGDAPFPKQKELDEAIAKQKELDAEYNKLGQSEEDKTKFRLLDEDDPKAMELESLPESELVPVYRNVQAFEDDALGSPMAFTDAETGERRTLEGRRWNYSAPPKVELTEEQQRKLDELNKNGYIMVDGKKSTELQINDGLKFVKPKTKEAQLQYFLKKNPEDKGTWAAYDPYDHAIETPLNTQFGEAYKRPNLVVVRSLIPKSEIDEPFHADYALLPTGAHQWNNGRTLYLSRWSKIDKVLTREEEAKLIDEYWKKHPGKREELKTHRDYNRFVPQVRRELEKMGYRFELDGKELTPEESLALDKQNWESRDVIPGREGHTPFVSNEDIARINAKMAGKWVGEPKEAMESAMSERVTELSERLHTPVRIIRTEEEVAALPSVRQRRMKGSFNPMTGEVTIVVPNNANMADIENTFVHEVVGHDGLRVLFPDEAKLNNALDELYRVSKDEIRGTIDRMAQKMYDAEVDRIREKKRKEHVANGEDANASYYADMAAAHAEAGKKREQFKRDATEEYGADLAGRIGEKGFEKMSAEELTFWGKLKAMLQKALQKLLDGLKIPGKRKWGDKDWAFVLHEAYKRKKNGGKPTVFDAADTEVMRRKTGFGDTKFSDGYKKSAQPNEAALKHLEPIDVEHAAKDNHSPETDPDGGIMFRDGDMGLEETITKMKVEASQANADNWQAKQDAMRAIGGNLNKLRQAMARQRAYDLSTVKSITDLAKVLLENGLLDDLSKYETKRILSAVNNVHGKQDVSDYVQKVMDIMVDNQLRMGANQLGKLLSIRGSRVDARGIEVQGQLDPEGQRIAQVVRKATSLPKENIEERIADCTNRMSSDDNAVAEEAAIEYSGLLLAHQFVEDITESKAEEKALRESIKEAKADLDAGTMEADAYREYVESTNDAIRQNKIERAEAYRSIVEQVGGVLGGSVERAKAWREAEKQRVETIHHNANSDMTGRPNDEHHKESKAQKIANNSIVRFVLAPLGTFDQMLRMFGKKSVNGEGYLWNRYMRGWVEATEKEYTGYQNALKTLDEKVSEVFDKKMKWGDLFSLERNLPKATVTFWDGGEQKAHELTQGNLLYIYMVDKMADGRMKLRRMGITEEDVENIKEFVDPRFLELADWMQDEFLVEKRNEYNEVHKRMFGASMAAIENYFPLKILANARIEEVDVADDTTDTALPATSTGSIIKRRRNNLALDVMGADAFSVILDHIQQMERWASFAEFNRDLNTLLSYKRFRNQVMNMTSVYGGGKTLWKNFRNVCSMAAGAYRPPIAALDKAAVNVAKGVTAAKVSFRVFTALKQFLSMPAYLSDSSPVYLAGNIANPIGAWKWSMENLPLFEKRWKSRMAGDPRLMKSEMDWKMWQNRAVEIASRIGMSPNAFVDALTVAIGAHSMYQTKKKKYLRYGYDEETAEKRAKQDATILFNQTQQSSESAFLSTMQTDRSWLSVLFTVFRNSSMSYTRQLYDALRNLKHRFEPGYKGLTEEYLAKQMRRDGIDPDKADQNAKSEYRRSLMRDIVRVGVFGYLLQFAWNLGAYLPYLLLGDDKDEKSDMWHDIFCHTMFGSIEGLTGGDVMSAVGNGFAKGEGLNLFSASKDMPLSSDLQNIVNKWNKDKVAAMNDVTNLMVQSGIGVNPQSLTDAVVAIMDYCGDDANTSRECALLITRIINCPQSQIDKIYFDELNATAAEAQGMTPAEIAERYARYKMHRGAPLTGWAYTDEARDSVMTAQQNRVLTKAKEKLNSRMETEETKQLLSDYDAIAKQETALSKIKKTDRAAYREGMKQLRQSNDMRQHMRLKRYKHDMKELTSKYLRCKSAEERDLIVSTMFSTRAKMLEDIGRLKQQ